MSQAGIINMSGGGGGGSPVQTLTGNNAVAVPPTGNNINVVGAGAVTVTGNAGTSTLTITVNTDSFTWLDEAAPFNAAPQFGYFCTGAITATLPVTAGLANGATIIFYVDSASSVTIQTNVDQQLNIGNMISSVLGTAFSNSQGSTLTLSFRIADTSWHAISSLGSWTTT